MALLCHRFYVTMLLWKIKNATIINLPICRERVEILFFYWSDVMELLINILAYIVVSVYVLSIIVFSIASFVLANIDRFKNEEAQDEDYY